VVATEEVMVAVMPVAMATVVVTVVAMATAEETVAAMATAAAMEVETAEETVINRFIL